MALFSPQNMIENSLFGLNSVVVARLLCVLGVFVAGGRGWP